MNDRIISIDITHLVTEALAQQHPEQDVEAD